MEKNIRAVYQISFRYDGPEIEALFNCRYYTTGHDRELHLTLKERTLNQQLFGRMTFESQAQRLFKQMYLY